MKVQTLIKQWLSSPALRLVHVSLIAILGLGVLWWAMHVQPVKAADPSLIYVRIDGDNSECSGQFNEPYTTGADCAVKTIQQGVITVTVGGTVSVTQGVYTEIITISKSLTLTASGLVTLTAPTDSVNNTLIAVKANNVTIDGLTLTLNRPYAVAGITAGMVKDGDTQEVDGLTVRNCTIQDTIESDLPETIIGIGAGAFSNRYNLPTSAVGIAVLSDNRATIESVTLTNNHITLNGSLEFGSFTLLLGNLTRGIWLREVYGEVTNNVIEGLAHDALVQFAYGGTTTLSDNQFWGAGLDITEPNSGPIIIADNTFAPWTADFAQSLLIKHNYMPLGNPVPVAVDVSANTFTGHTVGILSAASRGVTVHDNVFTPSNAATVFTHTQVNTAYPTGGEQSALGGENAIIFTNNTFQASTTGGFNGAAIEILNENSKGAVDFNPVIIGGTPAAANTFHHGLARTVWLGANVANTNPAINAYWNDWGYGTVHEIEATLHHQPDDDALAKIDFYDVTLAAAPTTQRADGVSPIQVTATITGFLTPGNGSAVAFATSLGNMPPQGTTNGDGQATATLTSTDSGPAWITATAGVTVNHPVSAVVEVVFTPYVDLALTKSDGGGIIRPGDTLTYTLSYTNVGAHEAANVVITETVPPHTTFAGPTGWTCPNGAYAGSICAYSAGALAADAPREVAFAVDVAYPFPAGGTLITNTASIADLSSGADPTPGNNTYTLTTAIDAAPNLEVSKDNRRATVQPGETLAYLITITNTGNQNAAGIIVTDTLPVSVTLMIASNGGTESALGVVTWPAFNLAGGGTSVTRLVVATMDTPLLAGVTGITNTVVLRDNRGYTATYQEIDAVDANPILVLAKTDGVTLAAPGAPLTYTITLTNTGNQEARDVVLTDTLPISVTLVTASEGGAETEPGIVVWPPLNLPGGGASVTRQLVVKVDDPLPAGVDLLINTIEAATGDPEVDPAIASDINHIDAAPALAISKSDGETTVAPGQMLTYTIVVTNTGNQGAGDVRITDYLPEHTIFENASEGWSAAPGGVTWSIPELPGGGASVTRFVTVTVASPFPAETNVITNTATVTDDGASSATAFDVNQVDAAPSLQLTKDDGVTTAQPGDTLIYRLVITNTGNQRAAGIVLTDTLPAHTTFALASDGGVETAGVVAWPPFDLSGGASATRLLAVTVANPLPLGVTAITNTAALRDNRGSTAEATDVDVVDANPILVLAKSSAVTTTVPGALITYTLTLTNAGNQAATGVVLTDTLPANVAFVAASDGGAETAPNSGLVVWPTFDLPGGGSVTRRLTVTVDSSLPAGVELLVNTARAREERGYTATAQHADSVEATPDLAISKTNGEDTVAPDQTLVYTLTVTNTGNQAATGIRITDYLPAHTAFVAATNGGSQTTPGVVTWLAFALDGGGARVTRVLTVTVAAPFPAETNVITNTAAATDDGNNGPDPTPLNNTTTDVDIVFAAPNLRLSKSDHVTTARPGDILIYRLVITNAGSQLAAGIALTDTLPTHTAFSLASDGGQETAPGIVTWPAFDLPGNDTSVTRLLVVTVNTPLPAGVTTIANTAVLRDNRGFTADATDIDAVDANPLLTLDKTSAITTAVPGATFAYTLTLTNNGNQAATGISITDTLPADVAFAAASDGGYEMAPGIIAWPTFDLPGGGVSVTRQLTVTVNPTLPAGLELLINTAHASEDRGYSAVAQHVDSVVAAPDLAIAKTDNGATPRPGDMLLYTLSYANVGNQGATGVVIAETVPAYTTFDAAASSPGWMCAHNAPAGTPCAHTVGDLPANASGNVTFAARVVSPLPVSAGQTQNTTSIADDAAFGGGNGADPDPVNNTASIITPFNATIDLLVGKDDGGITVEPGQTLVYTLTYANSGDQIAGGVVITETVPALTTFNQTASSPGWTCVHGAPAETVCTYPLGDVIEGGTLFFAVDVVLPFPIDVSEITNQVVIGADANNIPDANPDNNTATAITPIITRPNLVAGKDDGFSVVLPEQQFTYAITVTNVGTQNATNVQIIDTLPAHVTFVSASDGGAQTAPGIVTWPLIAQLALDEVVTRTLDVVVHSALPAGVSHITNTVTVSDDGTHGPDLNPDDNTTTDVNIVGAMPDLALYKTVDHAVIYPNGPLIYTIRVENTGSQGATGVSIIDTLPPDAHFVSAADGGYESAPGVVTWPAFALSVGEQAVYTLTVQAASNLPEGLVLTNTASVSDNGANGADPILENNTDAASSVIEWPVVYLPLVMRKYSLGPDLIIEDIVVANGAISITIRNQGQLPVPAALGFWVDLYINPSPAPTHVNQTWDSIASYGAAWGVDREALPILPGESQIIYLHDIYYKPDYSHLPAALLQGDVIYVQVDSFNATTTYGAVLENHEMSGIEYNNIRRKVIESYEPLNPVTTMHSVPEAMEAYPMPERP